MPRYTPSEFLDRYHNLFYELHDGTGGTVQLSNYVSGQLPDVWGRRSILFDQIRGELRQRGVQGSLPSSFTIDSWLIEMSGLCRVYLGKGSPEEIADVIWLAHRYGLITNPARPRPGSVTAQQFADRMLGLDCNGFVGNYLGVNPDQGIPRFGPRSRQRQSGRVAAGDVVISKVGDRCVHIAMLEDIQPRGADQLLTIVEWGGRGQANHRSQRARRLLTDRDGYAYYESSHQGEAVRKYFYAPPPEAPHRGYTIAPLN